MYNILKRIFSEDEIKTLNELIVYNTKQGYELFGEFSITKVNGSYLVSKLTSNLSETFYNLKNAVVWATMHKRNMIIDANRVRDLDRTLESTLVSMTVHTKLCEKTKDLDTRLIYSAKLQEDRVKRKLVIRELESYILNTKNWQEKQFKLAIK